MVQIVKMIDINKTIADNGGDIDVLSRGRCGCDGNISGSDADFVRVRRYLYVF